MRIGQVSPTQEATITRRWGWTTVCTVLLSITGPLGLVVMNVLQDRADEETALACRRDRANASWSKGFDQALPVSLFVLLVVAVVLALVILVVGRRVPIWGKPVTAVALFVALVSGLQVGLIADEYDDYPGGDISSLNGPCGA
ncbi:hypothetical protein OHR68_10210 [Spirillospora sp. NBC_00431]